jgi:excisionase family DNA binding protein
MLTPEELAQRLKLNVKTVRRMLSTGELPGIKIGRAWRTPARDLERFLEEQRKKEAARGSLAA